MTDDDISQVRLSSPQALQGPDPHPGCLHPGCLHPGTLLVGLVVDSPQGPRGLCGGRRGVQVSAYTLCAVCALGAAVLPRAPALLCAMTARAVGAAANSAMWIAAPELYPTHVSPAPSRPAPPSPAPPRRSSTTWRGARCEASAPLSLLSSHYWVPCPRARGSTPSNPHGSEPPASALPMFSQPPSPRACAPKTPLTRPHSCPLVN